MKVYIVTSRSYGVSHSEDFLGIGATIDVAKRICETGTDTKLFETREEAEKSYKDIPVDYLYIYKPEETCYYEYYIREDGITEWYDGEIKISEYEVQSE